MASRTTLDKSEQSYDYLHPKGTCEVQKKLRSQLETYCDLRKFGNLEEHVRPRKHLRGIERETRQYPAEARPNFGPPFSVNERRKTYNATKAHRCPRNTAHTVPDRNRTARVSANRKYEDLREERH